MTLDMTKGLIALPPIRNRIIPDAQNTAWDNLGPRVVKGFVLHRMLGSLSGTDQFFRGMAEAHAHFEATGQAIGALTDFGQDGSSGEVFQWNDPTGAHHHGSSPNRSGWASGPFNSGGDAYGDGLAFGNKYGISAINRDQVSWEISGMQTDPWTPAAMVVAARACAHYAHDYGIPHAAFPIAPQDGFSFLRWHEEFCGPSFKQCPFSEVKAKTDAFIAQVRAILKGAQTGTVDHSVAA
jgi:hypothetical protein